jgi:hypothetical protein
MIVVVFVVAATTLFACTYPVLVWYLCKMFCAERRRLSR